VPFIVTPFLHLGDPTNPHDRTRRAYLAPALLDLLRAADRVFVQTKLERQALLEWGLSRERLVLLGMGVDPAECTGGNRHRARRQWQIAPEDVVIGHLANKSVEKGTVDLLQAAEKLWQAGVRFHLLLAGPEMPNFTQYWQGFEPARSASEAVGCPSLALRPGPIITRLGVLTEDEKRDFYATTDIFALPSRSDSFGLVLLEAWANGIPCVGYRAGGIAEVIRHEQDGLLADCGDLTGLAGALRRLVEDDGFRRQLGKVGQDRVRREHQWRPRLELVRRTYQEVIEEKKSHAQPPRR
jgi:glycosyltransferase involved in cell wall biosynthesis